VGCLARNKPFNSDVDPDHNPDPGIKKIFLQLCDRANCMIFAPNSINNEYNAWG